MSNVGNLRQGKQQEMGEPGAVFTKPLRLTKVKLDFLTNAMHLLYALVRKSSFSKAQGFVKPAPEGYASRP